jgi:hypothetical protein
VVTGNDSTTANVNGLINGLMMMMIIIIMIIKIMMIENEQQANRVFRTAYNTNR